jgi:pilus assembly protein Flp/PilA
MSAVVERFIRNEDGATSIEYALIASLISVVILTSVTSAGQELGAVFQKVADAYASVQ